MTAERKAKMHEEAHKDYLFKKGLGLCAKCGREPARKGRTLCLECSEKANYNSKRYREGVNRKKVLDEKSQYGKRIRLERKAKGLCTGCGKQKPATGYVMCETCRKKKRITNRRSWAKSGKAKHPGIERTEWYKYGFCYSCGEEPPMEGFKICKRCYDKNYPQIVKAQELADKSYWRSLNRGIKKKEVIYVRAV